MFKDSISASFWPIRPVPATQEPLAAKYPSAPVAAIWDCLEFISPVIWACFIWAAVILCPSWVIFCKNSVVSPSNPLICIFFEYIASNAASIAACSLTTLFPTKGPPVSVCSIISSQLVIANSAWAVL